MNALRVIGCGLAVLPALVLRAEDPLDRVDDALTMAAWHDAFRARLSGTLDLEEYHFSQPAPGLIFADGPNLFNPRLTLFLDVQAGPRVYAFAQVRADRAFDPADQGTQVRLEEFAVRVAPGPRRLFNLQFGKFATVVGSWTTRHDTWSNPFISAPLPYENPTGIWDSMPVPSVTTLLYWSHVRPSPLANDYDDKYRQIPIIWGPSYASGAAASGTTGRLDYSVEIKNTALGSRPEIWDPTQVQWQHPTFSGRLGFRPNEMWNVGFSASTGSYLRPSAESRLPAGRSLDDYREILFGQDVSFAWHHVQVWAECFETRFTNPEIGDVDTVAYYGEVKYKFTPQFFGALRWNQQFFSTVHDALGAATPWGQNAWRLDLAPAYRFTAHTQLKLQVSLGHQAPGPHTWVRALAAQFTVRF